MSEFVCNTYFRDASSLAITGRSLSFLYSSNPVITEDVSREECMTQVIVVIIYSIAVEQVDGTTEQLQCNCALRRSQAQQRSLNEKRNMTRQHAWSL